MHIAPNLSLPSTVKARNPNNSVAKTNKIINPRYFMFFRIKASNPNLIKSYSIPITLSSHLLVRINHFQPFINVVIILAICRDKDPILQQLNNTIKEIRPKSGAKYYAALVFLIKIHFKLTESMPEIRGNTQYELGVLAIGNNLGD